MVQVEAEGRLLQDVEEALKSFLLTGTSFLFTWNVGAIEDPDAEWRHFLEWRKNQAVGRFKSIRFSATMEESLLSETTDRVHIDEQREVCTRLNRASLDPFTYTTVAGQAIRPNCAPNYLEAVGSSSNEGVHGGEGPLTGLLATGPTSTSKRTSLAHCSLRLIGRSKRVSVFKPGGSTT